MIDLDRPVNTVSSAFLADPYACYERIREERPVHEIRISVMKLYAVSRYEDCEWLLKDPRILRNRSTATGGARRTPMPLPASIRALVQSMILEDDPAHRRLRELVRHGFRPQAIARIEQRIDAYSHELLDDLLPRGRFDLQAEYALPIPVRMIADMMGIGDGEMPRFANCMSILSKGFTGVRMLRTLLWDLPEVAAYVRELIRSKRQRPGDDILTGLIEAEHEGDRLREDELVAMVFLLIIAGYETTVHLITNMVHTLLAHPDQLALLRSEPDRIDSAVEEALRHRGPVHATKPGWLAQDIELHGTILRKGRAIVPLLAAANHDPRVFDAPGTFDITRTPNRHLGFGHGIHFCLGAHLARAETRIAVRNLLERAGEIRLAVPPDHVRLLRVPLWYRFDGLPVTTGAAHRRAA